MKRVALVLSAWLMAASVYAQATAEPEPRLWSLRLAGGVSWDAHFGPAVELNGRDAGNGGPVNFMPLPTPSLMVRLEVPLHTYLVLGAQASTVWWTTLGEEALGMSAHYGADVSAVARLRIPLGRKRQHELLGSLAFGPTFDVIETGPRNYGETIDEDVGWHLGPFAGWQYVPMRKNFGFFAEAGFTYHRLTHTIAYEIEGQRAQDEITYQPVQVFLRGGFVFVMGH